MKQDGMNKEVGSSSGALGQGSFENPVKKLRGALKNARELGSVDNLIDAVSETFDQLAVENNAMAEELLTVYEQLGVVFDVSSRLSVLESEEEIVETFASSLKRSFVSRKLCLARCDEDGLWKLDAEDDLATPQLYQRLATLSEREKATVEAAPAEMADAGVAEVMAIPVRAGDTPVCVVILYRTSDAPAFRASEMMLIESLAMFCGDVIRNYRLVSELRQMSVAMVRSLVNAVDQKDAYTCGHSLRVAHYASILGGLLGFGEQDLQILEWAALLHDVGKIGIRDNVLNKSGKLTPDEFRHIQEHPVRSHQVVGGVPQLAAAMDGILYHHERYDGSGYPKGLKGEEIPKLARIIQIADVFDALTSNRSYREAFDWQRALEIMDEEAGQTIDPEFGRLFGNYVRGRVGQSTEAWAELFAEANAAGQVQRIDPEGQMEGSV